MEIHGEDISAELERNCAQEPIHLLGTVQPYGFLMVIEVASARILQVSSGITRHWPGLKAADALIGQRLADWVVPMREPGLIDLQTLAAAYPLALPWRPCFEQTGVDPAQAALSRWDCLGHRCGDYAVLEWLPITSVFSDPWRHDKVFRDFGEMMARLRRAEALDSFYDESAKVMQQFTTFDRVMVYRFLPDGCGEVVAEHTSADCAPKYMGLRFPATDIPAQARALYLSNKVRMLADVDAPADALIPPLLPDGHTLDQSFCVLRAFSPIHLIYLRNMEVKASLSMSIVCDGKLWGLIACHHPHPMTLPLQIWDGMRQVCELLAEIVNTRIEALTRLDAVRQRFTFDRLINQCHQELLQEPDLATVLDGWLPRLLPAFNASALGLRMGDLAYVGGPTRRLAPAPAILDQVASLIDRHNPLPQHQVHDDLLSAPDKTLPLLPEAAGLLLAQRFDETMNFCFLTREEVVQQVRWGGQPAKDLVTLADGQVRLQPRRSFKEWRQSVHGYCDPWQQIEAESLQELLRVLTEVHHLHLNRQLHQTMQWQAHHDHLTGLFNRRAMEEAVSRRLGEGKFDLVMMLLDLDHFKKINDTYGHETGDQVLQELGRRLKATMRNFDVLARLGGDEFMALLQLDHPSEPTALKLAKRLHRAVSKPMDVNGQHFRLGISVGISIPPGDGRTVSELLRHADLALYQAKSAGRSRSAVFHPSMASDQREDYLLECDLKEAIDRDQLCLYFQPKVDLNSCKVVGMEALVRWRHPSAGEIGPAVFIPIAERSEQITRIDRWVMRKVIELQAQWRAGGLPIVPIAINLSVADIMSPTLVSYLTRLLDEFKVEADRVEVEVTESCFIRELDETRNVLSALNHSGIATTLDDFGTGFSSLSYLRQLPLQCLKIDQSFIASMLHDANAEKLTQAIVAMGVALKMNVVGEGIETSEQMTWLLDHGCHVGQGYYFSPPVPPTEVFQVIERIEERLAA